MTNRTLFTVIIASIMMFTLFIPGPAMAKFTAEEAAKLDAEAKATVEKFLADNKGSKALFDDAKGILVYPKIRKAGL